jgi:hypothetical protein
MRNNPLYLHAQAQPTTQSNNIQNQPYTRGQRPKATLYPTPGFTAHQRFLQSQSHHPIMRINPLYLHAQAQSLTQSNNIQNQPYTRCQRPKATLYPTPGFTAYRRFLQSQSHHPIMRINPLYLHAQAQSLSQSNNIQNQPYTRGQIWLTFGK